MGKQSPQYLFRKAVRALENVPKLSISSFGLIELANDPSVDIEAFVLEINKNPALVVKLLSLANSVYFRAQSPIVNVQEAVVRIGLNRAKALTVSIILSTDFNANKHAFDVREHWLMSMLTATIANKLSAFYGNDSTQGGLLFTVGLLHNFGEVVMSSLFPKEIAALVNRCDPLDAQFTIEFNELFCFNQYQAVAWLFKSWALPDVFFKTIGSLGHVSETYTYDSKFMSEIDLLKTAQRLARHLIVENKMLNDPSIKQPVLLSKDELFKVILNKTAEEMPSVQELANKLAC